MIYRNSRGGGVLVAVKNSLLCSEIPSPLNLEIVCVPIESTNHFLLCTVYLPPNPDLSHFEAMIEYFSYILSLFNLW